MGTDSQLQMKIDAAAEALREVRSGMTLGLGTGSTAREFVRLLGEKIAAGEITSIRALCTSLETERQAAACGIEILEPKHLPKIALAVDGADEIDPALRLVKGLGGALLREKIVEQASERFIVIADETKLVEKLGRGVLPVEVTRFAMPLLEDRFRRLGIEPKLRTKNGEPFVTDELHLILDVKLPAGRDMATWSTSCGDSPASSTPASSRSRRPRRSSPRLPARSGCAAAKRTGRGSGTPAREKRVRGQRS